MRHQRHQVSLPARTAGWRSTLSNEQGRVRPGPTVWRGHDTIDGVADVADWIWWLVAAVILVVAELFTGTFVLLMLGTGALAASIAGLLGAPGWLMVLVFAVVSALSLWLLRPWINKRFGRGKEMGLAVIEGA